MKNRYNIFTLNGYTNYGNRLQLFAMSKTLEDNFGKTKVYWPKNLKRRIRDMAELNTPLVLLHPKERKLRRFTKKYIPKVTTRKSEFAIVGSDQVWNPKYLATWPYLLDAPSKEAKISYAASISKETLDAEEKRLFFGALKEYRAISVREHSAKELLQPLVHDKEIEVVLDPTLLLDRKDYEMIERKPKNLDDGEKYILCYILGGNNNQKIIEDFAKKKGYKTILFSDRRDSDYGVEEFLYLVHHAELICTDSFHACVFSFIFERPFVAFKRTGEENYMYTRLQNLINTFELKNREFDGEAITEDNLRVDYRNAKNVLKNEQKKSLDFLRRSLGE